MKKMFFLAIAAMGLTLASCNKEAKTTDGADSTAVEAAETEVEIQAASVGGGVAAQAAEYTQKLLKAGLSGDEAATNAIEAEIQSWASGLSETEAYEASQAIAATIGENYDALIEYGVDEAMKEDPNAAAMGREALVEMMKTMMPKENFVKMMEEAMKAEIDKQR